MKKMNNKGFSLVELIIVIAIMAILAGAIAPALIRYIDKSRKSNDVSSGKTIKTAVETAMGNETIYELLTTGAVAADDDGSGDVKSTITVNPPSSSEAEGSVTVSVGDGENKELAESEIKKNIGEKTPKLKYKKNAKDPKNGTAPSKFEVTVTAGGTVKVYIVAGSDKFEIAPELCNEYQ